MEHEKDIEKKMKRFETRKRIKSAIENLERVSAALEKRIQALRLSVKKTAESGDEEKAAALLEKAKKCNYAMRRFEKTAIDLENCLIMIDVSDRFDEEQCLEVIKRNLISLQQVIPASKVPIDRAFFEGPMTDETLNTVLKLASGDDEDFVLSQTPIATPSPSGLPKSEPPVEDSTLIVQKMGNKGGFSFFRSGKEKQTERKAMECERIAQRNFERIHFEDLELERVKKTSVQYSVVAPKRIERGETFLLDFFMYEQEFSHLVERAIKEGEGKLQSKSSGISEVEAGGEITVRLSSPNLPSLFEEESFVWEKGYRCVQLLGEVPSTYSKNTIILVVDVLVYGLKVASLKCAVNLEEENSSQEFLRVDIKKAFFSYSSEDRDIVLTLKQGMEGLCPDITCFVDFLFLKGGDDWLEEIHRKIDQSDCLFLIWSENAYKSQWVREEWSYALKTRGLSFIHPLAIESIDKNKCPVPEQLESMHFGNVNALLRQK